jgi:hypothetical protein
MDDGRAVAALNIAEWCDVVCRTHGARTRFDGDAWTCPTRTPPYYPDAVTLVPDLSVPGLLARIDTSTGCSIKDSFASLDLTDHGFRVLFDAQWIVHTGASLPPDDGEARWEPVRDVDDFDQWVEAWRGADDPADVLRAELLEHDSVVVLAARSGDRLVAGAILNRSANAVGISNFFAVDGANATSWSGCLAFARSHFGISNLVGYESGDRLAAAPRDGFDVAGPVRVWIREDPVAAHR